VVLLAHDEREIGRTSQKESGTEAAAVDERDGE
jgi:hypothetical protein